MSKLIQTISKIKSWFFAKIFNINWDLEDDFQEDDFNDERYANCRRHGGVAKIINCWECQAEFREDDYDQGESDE
jgi:hypothetical protein